MFIAVLVIAALCAPRSLPTGGGPGARPAPLQSAATASGLKSENGVSVRPRRRNPAGEVPALPSDVSSDERARLDGVVRRLVVGRFAEAAHALRPLIIPADVPVYMDALPAEPALRPVLGRAVAHAIHAWNAALHGSPQFRVAATPVGARLVILLAPAAGSPLAVRPESLESQPQRTQRVWVALPDAAAGSSSAEHELTTAVTLAIGAYLGVPTGEGVELRPSVAAARAKRLGGLRLRLLELAGRGRQVTVYAPAFVVDRTAADAGTVRSGDSARFAFQIANHGTAPLDLQVNPACGCTLATFDRTVPPGGRGRIEGEVRTSGLTGHIEKELEVRTNDPDRQALTLRIRANVIPALQVSPAESLTLALRDDAPTVQAFDLRLADSAPISVTGVECDQPFASAVCTPAPASTTGISAFRVTLTVSSQAPVGRTSILAAVKTTSMRQPRIVLHVVCAKGVLVSPVSVYLGAVSPIVREPLTRVATISRTGGAFHILRTTCDDPALSSTVESVRAGQEYRLSVSYRGGWTAGIVRRDVVVETDDPRQPRIVVPVSASVVAAEAGG